MARLIQVIETERTTGNGEPGNPHRLVRQYFTPEGELLAEVDDWLELQRHRRRERIMAVLADIINAADPEQRRALERDQIDLLLRSGPHRAWTEPQEAD
jgi:hypothetical protein